MLSISTLMKEIILAGNCRRFVRFLEITGMHSKLSPILGGGGCIIELVCLERACSGQCLGHGRR
jgi:hypothetical protein